jgi:hypothetical protein
MKIQAKNIELFTDFSQYSFDGDFYDFHNDFDCEKVLLQDSSLFFIFKSVEQKFIITLVFNNCIIKKVEMDNLLQPESATIDILYRGRFEQNQELLEFSSDLKSYFYVEFSGNLKIEFLSDSFELKSDFAQN